MRLDRALDTLPKTKPLHRKKRTSKARSATRLASVESIPILDYITVLFQ